MLDKGRNSEDDKASDISDSDVENVEDQEDPSHYESSSSSDDVDSESDTDEMSHLFVNVSKRFHVNFISDHTRYLLIIINYSFAH